MESENESRPLLHTFQDETWRSRMRKRCMRIPSEVTITGIILGLFLVVVTLLILLENSESTNESELKLGENLLASPFKYNKKALDKTWQDKKESMKPTKKYKDQKWDTVDKGWKKISASSGLNIIDETKDSNEDYKDEFVNIGLPVGNDEYEKELDSFETSLEQQWSIANAVANLNKGDDTSSMKWKKVNDGWKKLTGQGWKDTEIKEALINALKEKDALKVQDVSQSDISLDGIWDKINENWKKNLDKGDKVKGKQKTVNDDWKNKMNILKSTASDKSFAEDEGFKTLSEQGWKDTQIKKALIEALKEKDALKVQGVLQSPISFDDMWGKINEKWGKNLDKGEEVKGKQKTINDDWKNKMNVLQSPTSDKSLEKDDEGFKALSDQGWKTNDIKEALVTALKEHLNILNFDKFMDDVIESIKDLQKDQSGINGEKIKDGTSNSGSHLQSSMPFNKMHWTTADAVWKRLTALGWKNKQVRDALLEAWKDVGNLVPLNKMDWNSADEVWKKLTALGWKDKQVRDALLEAWKDAGILEQSAMGYNSMKWKKVDNGWKKISNKNQSGINGEKIKDGTSNSGSHLQSSMPLNKMDWTTADAVWKRLTALGWKDKQVRDALLEAWKDAGILEQSAMGYNSMKWKKVDNGWKKISNKSISMPTRCPIFKTHQQPLLGSAMAVPPVNCALIAEDARRKLGKCIDLSFLPQSCKPSWRIKCFSTYKYRKIDGTCNNKIHPTWGKSGTPFVRMIAPDYADGASTLRTAQNGGPLPNPRFLSVALYSKRMKQDSPVTVLFSYFGLIVDHDMLETAVNSNAIPCCDDNFQQNPENRPRECLQIDVPNNDPFYGSRNVTCLNLVRSVPVNGECAGRREQLNKATSFLDGSAIYGSVVKQAKQLRSFNRGQLRTQLINNTPFMAAAEGAGYSCGTPNEPLKCFEAGDSRVNMMVELTAMHTLWHREHNRIATELLQLNPQWTDELIFQEARRILIGELQHITYKEFLPLLLGRSAMNSYELKIDESQNYEGYDDTVDPSAFNVFAAAAFRFGHSLIPDMQYLLGSDNSTQGKVPLHETFFNANILYHNGLDLLLRGAASQRTHTVDSYITPEVRDHLFQPADLDYGHDLAAVGIQRGRDHGLPAYTKWRNVCGLSEIKNWNDLYNIMDKERADALKNVYQSVEDIDLIPGALAENHEADSLVGPTYNCLIGRQFKKTRKGDRFWFEIQNEIGSFTKGQLEQIYKSNMARIICDNSDGIKKIQRVPFEVPSASNPVLDCNDISKVDLSDWKSNI